MNLSTRLVFSCLLLALPAPGLPALAEEDCAVPMADWQPRDAVAAFARAQGWQVAQIRLDDGCYEVRATDAKGHPIEAKLNPATLAILNLEIEDEDGADDD